jgi:peptide/nickel transport system substrate-binding protein
MFRFFQKNKSEDPPDLKNRKQHQLDHKLVFSLAKTRIPKLKQLKYISRFLSKKEALIVRILLVFVLINLVFLGTRFYFVHLKQYPRSGGEYIEGLVDQPQYINPILAPANETDQDLARLIFSGLLKYDKNQKLVPDLASSWTLSKDGKIYIFFLKKGVKWHDGEGLTADDVVFTVESIQDQEYKSPLWISFQGVKIEKIDDYQIRFILEEPFTPFLSLLTLGILPKHIWQGIEPGQANLAEANLKPIGTGPFCFQFLAKDKLGTVKSYTLERNEDYYDKKSFLKKIIFKFYQDPFEVVFALKNKKIQGISYLPEELKEELISTKHLNYHLLHLPQYVAIFFNQKKASVLEHKGVRLALSHAIDKEKIVKEVLGEEGEIIYGPFLFGSLGFNPELRKYPFDLDRANELLENAGWKSAVIQEGQPIGFRGTDKSIRKKGNQTLMLTITAVAQEENKKTAEIIKDLWQKIGVQVNLQIVAPEDIQRKIIKPRDYQVLLYSIITGFDPDLYPFWHSSQIEAPGLNITGFSYSEADRVLEEARMITDEKARHEKYQHFQNILIEQIPAIFLYNPTYTYPQDKKIKGFDLTRINLPSDRFANTEEWFTKVRRWF